MSPSSIAPKRKSPGVYRPIVVYALADSILEGQCARYLQKLFDPDFLPNSFAFRLGGYGARAPEHHDAAQRLFDYRTRHDGRTLWVAEVDIQSFFDSVHHDAVHAAFARAAARALKGGITVDTRAVSLLNGFLEGYTFPGTAMVMAQRWFDQRHVPGRLAWPEELKDLWPNLRAQTIGLPQGATLSNLLANLVLDGADRDVMKATAGQALYMRFLDDMIVVGPDKGVVLLGYERYLAVLESLKLPYHRPAPDRSYAKGHWSAKTRAPYRWTKSRARGCAPWVGYVGYQIRYDGIVRARPSSVEKEMGRHEVFAKSVLRSLPSSKEAVPGASFRLRSSSAITFRRVTARMVAASIGRTRAAAGGWCDGFRFLKGKRIVRSQMSALDRRRDAAMRQIGSRFLTWAHSTREAPLPVRLRASRRGPSSGYLAHFRLRRS